MKKLYENFSISDENMELPWWVWLELSAQDETNIAVAQQFLKSGTQFKSVVIEYVGGYDTSEMEGKWRTPQLTVTPYDVWFSDVEDWTGGRYEFNLTDEAGDSTYKFDNEGNVVEVSEVEDAPDSEGEGDDGTEDHNTEDRNPNRDGGA